MSRGPDQRRHRGSLGRLRRARRACSARSSRRCRGRPVRRILAIVEGLTGPMSNIACTGYVFDQIQPVQTIFAAETPSVADEDSPSRCAQDIPGPVQAEYQVASVRALANSRSLRGPALAMDFYDVFVVEVTHIQPRQVRLLGPHNRWFHQSLVDRRRRWGRRLVSPGSGSSMLGSLDKTSRGTYPGRPGRSAHSASGRSRKTER